MENEYSGVLPTHIERYIRKPFLEKGKQLYLSKKVIDFDFIENSFFAKVIDKDQELNSAVNINEKSDRPLSYSCNCKTFGRHDQCQHIAALVYAIYAKNKEPDFILNTQSFYFKSSLFYMLSKNYNELYGASKERIHFQIDKNKKQLEIEYRSENAVTIFRFVVSENALESLLLKYKNTIFHKSWDDIETVFSLQKKRWNPPTLISTEFMRREAAYKRLGYKTPMQQYLESFWVDFGKIWYFSLKNSELQYHYDNENKILEITGPEKQFQFFVIRKHLSVILGLLFADPIYRKNLSAVDEQTTLDYSITIDDNLDLKFTPLLVANNSKETIPIIEDCLENVIGRFIYMDDLGFIPFKRKNFFLDRDFFANQQITVPNHAIPEFINKYKLHIDNNRFYYVSPSLKNRNIIQKVKHTQIKFRRLQSNWCYLSIDYGLGNQSVSFYDIYQTIKAGKQYLIDENNWIDTQIPEFNWIRSLESKDISQDKKEGEKKATFKLTKLDFLKFYSTTSPSQLKIDVSAKIQKKFEQFIQFKPIKEPPSLASCKFELWDYQHLGYTWLWYLYENDFAGLLCDDMGLGKTYQSIALLQAIKAQKKKAVFLIICPTSVLHHWRNKVALVDGVDLHLYHGIDRELNGIKNQKFPVIITSYGIARRDIETLRKFKFDTVIFDEIQSAKNKSSLTFSAVCQLNAKMKLGLTGTPLENDLFELKTLFDIVLPGYFDSDAIFKERFSRPIEENNDKSRRQLLHRLISPFTLRRTKAQVLTDLPPKIEEIRTCELSQDQIKFYHDVIDRRAGDLIRQLESKTEKIPYMHIFAVLNYLKQICNHPSQLTDKNLDYNQYRSGKWELFCELLEESLNSGLKVVVFSQYLNMLALIEAYLKDHNIEFATIKGATRNREEMITRFNSDPNCMVFTGSLRAAGLGVDLTGGSVVIHYDRWWNAAREDQATDRVHRIGQTRGVQVFKLVTEGTLEEKIDLIIKKKKKLMDDLVQVDDAKLFKKFDREELINLLRIEL